MVEYQIPYEKIVYFPGVIPNISNLISTIEATEGLALTEWRPWFAYGETENAYGEIKYMQSKLLTEEQDQTIKNNSSYVLSSLVDAMAACAREYADIYDIDNTMLDFAEHALRYPETTYGINKYFEGQYMGPHVDWNEFNSDITYTIVVYLNDDYEGGELFFVDPSIDIKIKPKAGSIVMFPSNMPYLHQSCEITKGRKMLITHHWKNDSLQRQA
jgi:Rps23 Pro-64 3,4-dihydroxylase Tpa1-like proline 4-hydroxylase